MISFLRKSRSSKDFIIAIIHFTPIRRENYLLGVPQAKAYKIIFRSDESCYGGTKELCDVTIPTKEKPSHGFAQSITLTVPPLTALFLKAEYET